MNISIKSIHFDADKKLEKPKVKFVRTRDVKLPTRGTSLSAGMDIYVPNDFETSILKANEDILIDSGLKTFFPENFALKAIDKSGVCANKKLKVGAKLIDTDYAGEIKIHLINFSGNDVKIEPGMKLVQLMLVEAHYEDWEEIDEHTHSQCHNGSERGTGGFGHTDHK